MNNIMLVAASKVTFSDNQSIALIVFLIFIAIFGVRSCYLDYCALKRRAHACTIAENKLAALERENFELLKKLKSSESDLCEKGKAFDEMAKALHVTYTMGQRSIQTNMATKIKSGAFRCAKCETLVGDFREIGGYIYVLTNPLMPDVVKIGFTERSVGERAVELSAGTGVALPFDIIASFPVREPASVEKQIHEMLAHRRVSAKREFFSITASEAIKEIRKFMEANDKMHEQIGRQFKLR
jgi:hypothetical protein